MQKTIWQFKDGKRGHENQSGGLIKALSKLLPINCLEIDVRQNGASWWDYILGRYSKLKTMAAPDLIVGAGSQTHASILSAGRATKAPTVVIMSPPKGISKLFDLCIVPEHDGREGSNIITTQGALNLIQTSSTKEAHKGLVLVGGPSKHHDWKEGQLIEQLEGIFSCQKKIQWTLTTSRRTPTSTLTNLQAIQQAQLTIVTAEETDPNWLPDELAKASYCWVTEDSASMIYEALSSGAVVGALPLPRKNPRSRVIRGVEQLIGDGLVMTYSTSTPDISGFPPPAPLNEAKRIAHTLQERFFN